MCLRSMLDYPQMVIYTQSIVEYTGEINTSILRRSFHLGDHHCELLPPEGEGPLWTTVKSRVIVDLSNPDHDPR